MNSTDYLTIFSYSVFGGSIILIIYIVYYEWKKAKIEAETDEIEMGELKNEGVIDSLSDAELVDMANKEPSSDAAKNSSNTKKPNG